MTILNNSFFKLTKLTKTKGCFLCGGSKKNMHLLVNLPKYPITEFFREPKSKLVDKANFDQKIFFCKKHNHAFVKNILDVNLIYKYYTTTSHSSKGAIDCLENLFKYTTNRIKNYLSYDLIDIGGNDSTFLKFFKKSKNFKLNIDPNAYSDCKNIKIKKAFIEKISFKNLRKKNKTLFFSSHTLEHLENPDEHISKLSKTMNELDHAIFQFPSIEKMVDDKKFDQICHQHINYFSLYSINILCNKHGLYIHDYEYDESHFGTLRIHMRMIRVKNKIKKDKMLFDRAKSNYMLFKKYYKNLNNLLASDNVQMQGFGAGLMVPIMAYYLPVINSLKYIIDDNRKKNNKKYINLEPIIRNSKHLNKHDPVLITSVTSKEAGRKIFERLIKSGVKSITLPSVNN